jgi:hypothetical protein
MPDSSRIGGGAEGVQPVQHARIASASRTGTRVEYPISCCLAFYFLVPDAFLADLTRSTCVYFSLLSSLYDGRPTEAIFANVRDGPLLDLSLFTGGALRPLSALR